MATERGEPLADFTICFVEGNDYQTLTDRLNQLAADLFVHEIPWYDVPNLRIAVATKAALEREFGWVIRRVPHPSGGYWWESTNKPLRYPKGLDGCIADMGLSQPGANDDGQPYDAAPGRNGDQPAPASC
jgi:hypothetical protein